MFAFIIEGSCIALYSAPKSLELFYLLKVVRKTVADNNKIDIYDHTIQNGSQYIEGYLEKAKQTKGKVFKNNRASQCMFILVKYVVRLCLPLKMDYI